MSKNKEIRYDKISTYFKLNKKPFILATISGIFYNVLMVFVPIVQGKLINAFKEQKDTKYIILFALSFLLFVAFIQVNRFFKRYYVRDFANRITLQMRKVCFRNLILSDINDINSSSKGDIVNKNLSDIKDSAEGIRKILTEVYDSIILVIGYFISMLIMDLKVTLIIFSFLILSIVVSNLLKKVIYKTTSSYKKSFSKVKDDTFCFLQNQIYYRGFGVEKNYYDKYSFSQDKLEKEAIKSMTLKSSMEPIYHAISLIGLFFVIYLCGKNVISGKWLIGSFTAYLTTFILVSTKTSKVGKVFNAMATLKVSWKRCMPYLKERPVLKEISYNKVPTNLQVKDLSFGFNKDFILKNISFSLEKGNSLGICGMVHSGKSTLLAAMSGIYDYDGSIKLNGIELKEVKNYLIDDFIAYAPSQVEIFNDTLNYNISFDNRSIKKELDSTFLNEDVKQFANKEQELLSHSVTNISGGQQKRIQIARCLVSNYSLILMDDPFNAIDIKMSIKIVDNILNHCKDSIFIVVNNQKEILRKLDKIIFLKNNNEYLYGSYDELLKDIDFKTIMEEK